MQCDVLCMLALLFFAATGFGHTASSQVGGYECGGWGGSWMGTLQLSSAISGQSVTSPADWTLKMGGLGQSGTRSLYLPVNATEDHVTEQKKTLKNNHEKLGEKRSNRLTAALSANRVLKFLKPKL